MRWNVNGADYFYLCSASTASDFHLISAGHCVYNHDPIGNGSGVGAGFANEIWAWPAETDVVEPIDHYFWPDYPYGVSKATLLTTYNFWIGNSDLNWDFSFLTLDRRVGDHVGWMGREWNTSTTALNFDGYPAEYPYVPSDNVFQYPGFDYNNVAYYTCCRIGLFAYIYGGHSGGPEWRYDGTNDWIEGVNSTSNRAGSAEGTLLTSQIESDLENTIASDRSVRPPADLAQLIEWVFDNSSKGLQQTSAQIGASFGATLNAFNAGYADAGDTRADVYLTLDPNSVSSGRYVGTYDFGYIGTYQYTIQNGTLAIPTSVPPNTYYVGYLLYGANTQYGTDRNYAVISKQTLQVYCNGDAYEPDNIYTQASLLVSGGTQNHSICAQSDGDWATFTVDQASGATIQTSGSSGDTTMTLYDANLNQVDYNDDSGGTLFSTINRTCAANPLPAGQYYVLIQSFQNATALPAYNLSFSTSPCGPVASLSASSLSFAAQVVNTSSTPQNVILTNTGNTALNLTSISTSGDYTQNNNCGASLVIGGQCTIGVAFKPTKAGLRGGALILIDNAAGSPQTVSLTGTGTRVKLAPSSLTFPLTPVGQTSVAKSATLTNVGTTSLHVNSLTAIGRNPTDYLLTTNCAATVGPGTSCKLTVRFKPSAPGARTANVAISDNGGASPQHLYLNGTGH
jgi:hypothetical protein